MEWKNIFEPQQLMISFQLLSLFCRWVMGILFITSSVGKARNIAAFEKAVANFKLLPVSLIKPFAYTLIVGELTVVALMIAGPDWAQSGFILSGGLLLIFLAGLLSVLLRKITTSCNCFGPSNKMVSWFDIPRNIAFFLVAFAGWRLHSILPDGQINSRLDLAILTGILACAFIIILINLREVTFPFRMAIHSQR